MEMIFKNYCIVALGDIDGIIDIIKRVSENQPRKLEQKGVLICTFSSVMTVSEIKETINVDGKTFFIFEVGTDTAAYKIGRDDIHDQLFKQIEDTTSVFLKTLTSNLMMSINDDNKVSGDTRNIPITVDYGDVAISELTESEINEEIDNLLDKGLDNLTDNDKKRWELLTKTR